MGDIMHKYRLMLPGLQYCPISGRAASQRLRSLERLESLDIAYVNVGTYSMRLHIVRLTELLYLPRLRRLRLLVPGLHDEADGAAFLGANFMRQLREGCLRRLDVTLLSEDGGKSLPGLRRGACSSTALILHPCKPTAGRVMAGVVIMKAAQACMRRLRDTLYSDNLCLKGWHTTDHASGKVFQAQVSKVS